MARKLVKYERNEGQRNQLGDNENHIFFIRRESLTTHLQRLMSEEEELLPQSHGGYSSLEHEMSLPWHIREKQMHSQLPHIKEEEDPQLAHIKKEEEDTPLAHIEKEQEDTQLPHVKQEGEEPKMSHLKQEVEEPQLPHVKKEADEPQSSHVKGEDPQPPHIEEATNPTDHCGRPPPDNLLAPLANSDELPLTIHKDLKEFTLATRRSKRIPPLQDAEEHAVKALDKTAELEIKLMNSLKGRGLFAKVCFQKGDFVVEYRGELINSEESKKRRMSYHKACAVFMFDFFWKEATLCIDASIYDGSLGRVVNTYSRHPNCQMKVIAKDKLHLCLFALRDIHPGEEITCDQERNVTPQRQQDWDQPQVLSSDKVGLIPPPHFVGLSNLKESQKQCTSSSQLKGNSQMKKEQMKLDSDKVLELILDGSSKDYIPKRGEDLSSGDPNSSNVSASIDQEQAMQRFPNVERMPDVRDAWPSRQERDCALQPPIKRGSSHIRNKSPSGKRRRYLVSWPKADTSSDNGTKEQEEAETGSVSDDSAPDMQEDLPDWAPSPDRGSVDLPCVPGVSKKEDGSRMYKKEQYCLYGKTGSLKISRHREGAHRDKPEVVQALSFPKGSKGRRMCSERLRNQGNFTHNVEVLNSGVGTPVPCKRPRCKSQMQNFLHCAFCKGFFLKHVLWKHMKTCKFKPSNPPNHSKTPIQALCALAAPPPPGFKEQLWKLINGMNIDDVYEAVKSNPWIMHYGEHLYNRQGHDATKRIYIGDQMRALERLLVCSKKNIPMKTIKNHMRPSNFMHVIRATKDTAGYNCETYTYKSLILARKIGHCLERISKLLESSANVRCIDGILKDVRAFRAEYKARWQELLPSALLKKLKESKWKVPQMVFFTEDVQNLHSYLHTQQQDLFQKLNWESSPVTHGELTRVILTQITLFNRPRAGEISEMPLSAYLYSMQLNSQEDVNVELSDLERRLFQNFWRIQITGEADRQVPVHLTPVMLQTLDLLVRKRKECGILPENTYLFARPSSMIFYRGFVTLINFAKVCGAKMPETLSSQELHKQMGILSQVLNLTHTELNQLDDYLGHSINLQRQFYRIPEWVLQLAKMIKLMVAQEQGRLAQFKESVPLYRDQDQNPEEPRDPRPAYESDPLDFQQLISEEEEFLPQSHGGCSSLDHEMSLPCHIKEKQIHSQLPHIKEEEDPQLTHIEKEQEDTQLPHVKKEKEEPQLLYVKKEEEEPQLPHVEKEGEEPQLSHLKKEEEEPQLLPVIKEEEEPQLSHVQKEGEEPQLPHVKKDGDEPQSSHVKEEDPQPPHIKEEATDPKLPKIKEKQKHPHPVQIKEEEEDPKLPYVKEQNDPQLPHIKEEEEEFDISKLPLTGDSEKSKEDDKPPERSVLHHHSPSEDHCGGPPPDNLLAPLANSDEVPLTMHKDRKEFTLATSRSKRIPPLQDAEEHAVKSLDKTAELEIKLMNSLKGRGLFAKVCFQKGDFVVEYRGELINSEESKKRRMSYHKACAVFMFDFFWKEATLCIDASIYDGSLGRVVNTDSRHPNCQVKVIAKDKLHLCLFALRDIHPGEEITCDQERNATPQRQQMKKEQMKLDSDKVLELILDGSSKDYIPKRGEDLSSGDPNSSNVSASIDQEQAMQRFPNVERMPDVRDAWPSRQERDCALQPPIKRGSSHIRYKSPSGKRRRYLVSWPKADTSSDNGTKEQEEAETGSVSDDSAPDMQEDLPDWAPSPDRGSVDLPCVPGVSKKEDGSRMYNKKQYCLYCKTGFLKISRHLERAHRDEPEVVQALSFPKGSKGRRMCFEHLRNRGNFTHNVEVLNSGVGTPVPCKRPRCKSQMLNFLHCAFCKGYFLKNVLWKHMKTCKFKPSNPPNHGKTRVQALCALAAPPPPGVKEQFWNVINSMNVDDVYEAVKSDPCIMEYGQHLYNRHGHDATKRLYIRDQMRALGRLLVCSRKATHMKTIKDHMRPSNFMHVVQATKDTAGYNCETGTYKSPSLVRKIGHGLERISKLLESSANVRGNDGILKDVGGFRAAYKARWRELLPSASLKKLKEFKWEVPQLLLFTEDVQSLHSYLHTQQQDLFQKLTWESSPVTHGQLTKVILTQITLFNRPRAGEISKMPLSAYLYSMQLNSQEDVNVELSDLERRLFQNFWRIQITGKADRQVPVLLTPVMLQTLDLLVRKRKECGILPENTYLFARPSSMIFYHGIVTLRNFAKVSGANMPENLSSQELHKQMGILSQVLNLTHTELNQLGDFLGHSINLQRQFYRIPEWILQLAKIIKLVVAREEGRLAQFKGKSLDDIEIDPEESVPLYRDQDQNPEEPRDTRPAYESDPLVIPVTTGHTASLPNSKNDHAVRVKVRQNYKRKKWDKQEVDAVERHMMSFITSRQLPGKQECSNCLLSERAALRNRNWLAVKYYVRNRILARNSKV
ncbi:uncharacterized protein LOC133499495 isoform X2 [Syngnathoides biaculeatus]|uniref:uncharacterized protein LOC133499495 isoform X2 n=1 Tax=Syngnathoides biaculeatus TaxID=300417 RepID=UPI002ADE44F6|nr:uncharacterized protein LOC133499495 isoform X2 [Syngnathoides biaculeatus]